MIPRLGDSFTLVVHPDHPWVWEAAALRNCPDVGRRLTRVLGKIRDRLQRNAGVALVIGSPHEAPDLPPCGTVFHTFHTKPQAVSLEIIKCFGYPEAICGFWGNRCVMDVAKFFPGARIIRELSPRYPF